MHRKTIAVAALAAAMAGAGLSPLALAQSSDSEFEDYMLEEITVTATKREESIYDVPIAITAFTQEGMEIAGIRDLVDVGKFVPNLNVTEFSAGHTASVNAFIRGIGLQDHLITTDPGVSIYVDGVYLGRQVGQNWSLANVERVEVLRGPQGTLYGRNTIGGAINIITRKPGEEQGGRVALEVGTRGRLNGDFYTNMKFSDQWAMSITGAYKHRDGLGDFLLLDNPRKEVGELQDISARVALQWSPSEDFTLLLTADGNDGDNGLRPYTTLIDEVPNGYLYQQGYRNTDVAPPYDNNTGQADQTAVTNKAGGLSLTADWALSEELSTKLIVSDRHSEYSAGLDDDGMFVNSETYPEDGEADQTSAELQLNGNYDQWDFVAGLYYFKEDGWNDQDPNYFHGGPGAYYLEQDVKSKAIYANVGYWFTESFRLSGGLRYTKDKKDAYVDIGNGFVYTPGHRDWNETSWDISALYEFNDRLNLYGTIQNGYQSGQFPPRAYCLFGPSFDPSYPGNVNPVNCFVAGDNITAQNYEIGLKGQPTDYLRMGLALFYTDYKDLPYQVSTIVPQGFLTENIIVDQNSSGVEWESTLLLGSNFLFHAAIGYINVDVDEVAGKPKAVAPLTPEWTLAFSPEYTVPLSNGASLLLRVDYSYRDDMWGEPSDLPSRYTAIESRSLWNFDITYQAEDNDWTLSAYGRNAFDERYDQARLNVGDYILVQLSNDASEFGLRFTNYFGQ